MKKSETTKNLLKKNELCGGINISHSYPNGGSAYITSDYWNVHNYKISLLSWEGENELMSKRQYWPLDQDT